MSNDGVDDRMSDGRLFHARGPATANARSPMVELRVEGTTVLSTARRRLRSVSSANLVVPPTRPSTIGDRAFTVASPRAWNSLPSDIRSSTPSFDTFKKHLKSYLFQLSFSSL